MHKLFLDRALLPDGWRDRVSATVAGGRFIEVASGVDCPADAIRISGVAVPGLGNLHSHTFQRGFAGLTERRGTAEDHFWTWREAMYRFVDALTPEDVEAIAAMAFVEMVESGFTAVAEFHYLHHGHDGQPYADPAELSVRIAAAAGRAGIGLTLLPVFYAHGGFGAQTPSFGQRRFICDLDLFARLHASAGQVIAALPIGGIGIAPHSLRAVTREELHMLLGAHPSGPVHLHIAEQRREVDDCLAATGMRPVDWLLGNFDIDRRWCLVHATHMTPDETTRLARTHAVAGLCPITESNLGDGAFPAVAFKEAGGLFGIGSDSNVLIDAAGELRTLCYSQRLQKQARNLLATATHSSGRVLFETASAGGAQALGLTTGAIAPGSAADLVVLDPDHEALCGLRDDALLDAWIFASARSPIDIVICGGRIVAHQGRHVARDEVSARFRTTMRKLRNI